MPIHELPEDVALIPASMLAMTDLRNLRLTCRWATDGTCADFARRGYKRRFGAIRAKNLGTFSLVMDNPIIAAADRQLPISYTHPRAGDASDTESAACADDDNDLLD